MSRAGFLAAICEHPDDDTPRLIYADWLDEYGDDNGRARAAFIRAQVERARLPPDDPQYGLLKEQERKAAEHHFEAWRRELPDLPGCTWQRFWRGFVGGVTVQRGKF